MKTINSLLLILVATAVSGQINCNFLRLQDSATMDKSYLNSLKTAIGISEQKVKALETTLKLKVTALDAATKNGTPSKTTEEQAVLLALKKIREERAELDKVKKLYKNPRKAEFALFGAGSIKEILTGSSKPDNIASGSIGLAVYSKNRFQLIVGFSMNPKSTKELANKSDFGKVILNPDLGGQSFTLAYKRFGLPRVAKTLGVQAEFNISSHKWKIDSIGYSAIPISSRIGVVWRPFKESSKGDNVISLEFFGGYSRRSIIGNLRARKEFVQNVVPKTNYSGVELEASLILNSTTIYARLPWMISKDHIDNLTKGQLIIGATVNAELFEIK